MQLEPLNQKIPEECVVPISVIPSPLCSSKNSWTEEELMESKYRKLTFWRTKARSLFRILLAVGFLVQSWKFVEMYFQYPSTVELEVIQPSEVEMPAFTLCNINE
ncbi:hypothetical protein AVEN_191827-1 [Araneus ventricosus]|uniref:Uncharacterized protein n=1 Tax=Araneus ventricosus TaxID=182803 RepID=A0A4Y2U6I1_ARAVE|nr:hypothetical protein AVEN_191827-1 [Araneus ventricosus]